MSEELEELERSAEEGAKFAEETGHKTNAKVLKLISRGNYKEAGSILNKEIQHFIKETEQTEARKLRYLKAIKAIFELSLYTAEHSKTPVQHRRIILEDGQVVDFPYYQITSEEERSIIEMSMDINELLEKVSPEDRERFLKIIFDYKAISKIKAAKNAAKYKDDVSKIITDARGILNYYSEQLEDKIKKMPWWSARKFKKAFKHLIRAQRLITRKEQAVRFSKGFLIGGAMTGFMVMFLLMASYPETAIDTITVLFYTVLVYAGGVAFGTLSALREEKEIL